MLGVVAALDTAHVLEISTLGLASFWLGSEWCQAFCSLQNLHVGDGLKSSTSSFEILRGWVLIQD